MGDEYGRDTQLPVFKILLIGDISVGKTCTLLRFTEDTFSDNYSSSLGVDFKTKQVEVDGSTVKLQIWDFEGNQQRFDQLAKSRYTDADAILFLFDITNKESFDNIKTEWLEKVSQNKPKSTCCHMVVGTKCDLSSLRVVTAEDGKAFASDMGCQFIDTSAKLSTNVAQMFNMVAHDVLTEYRKTQTDKESNWRNTEKDKKKKNGNCVISLLLKESQANFMSSMAASILVLPFSTCKP
ncbi:Ras-related protein Rab [Acrasis kona]|uniref:Ras-related protein Rab n=1 Tax=Acrasis kona TaxID=1008807 RepID=A0AAW2YW40_9EUKA